jgi:outer membrane protein TolC
LAQAGSGAANLAMACKLLRTCTLANKWIGKEGELSHRQKTRNSAQLCAIMLVGMFTSLSPASAQVAPPSEFAAMPVQSNATYTQTQSPLPPLTLLDALERAQRLDPQFQSAVSDAKLAREDRLQSRATPLPSLGLSSQYLNTQGNGLIPTGTFVTNDGIHVYREWGVVRQDLSPATLTRTEFKRATATEALSQTKAEKARLALVVTVVKAYYGLLVTQQKYATAQQALDQANRLVDLGQSLEQSGRKPHSDVVKFQLQQTEQAPSLKEASLATESARLDLAVLLFRDFDEKFEIVDDLRVAPSVPSFSEVVAMAEAKDPDLWIALDAVRVASLSVSMARQAFLPTLKVEIDYGIESNCVGLRCVDDGTRALGPAPTLGYSMTTVLNVPVWDWGVKRSKLRQAEIKDERANLELSFAQRQLVKNLHAAYNETQTAFAHLNTLRRAADLAAENLRLNISRYQTDQAVALEVVDAQNNLTQARNALDDGELRYRVAVANLQTFTGSF